MTCKGVLHDDHLPCCLLAARTCPVSCFSGASQFLRWSSSLSPSVRLNQSDMSSSSRARPCAEGGVVG